MLLCSDTQVYMQNTSNTSLRCFVSTIKPFKEVLSIRISKPILKISPENRVPQ